MQATSCYKAHVYIPSLSVCETLPLPHEECKGKMMLLIVQIKVLGSVVWDKHSNLFFPHVFTIYCFLSAACISVEICT